MCFVMLALCSCGDNGAAAAPSVFADSLVFAKAEMTSMLGATNRLTMTYEKGNDKAGATFENF